MHMKTNNQTTKNIYIKILHGLFPIHMYVYDKNKNILNRLLWFSNALPLKQIQAMQTQNGKEIMKHPSPQTPSIHQSNKFKTTNNYGRNSSQEQSKGNENNLRLPVHNGDTILTSLKALIADERTNVNRDLDGAILRRFHR